MHFFHLNMKYHGLKRQWINDLEVTDWLNFLSWIKILRHKNQHISLFIRYICRVIKNSGLRDLNDKAAAVPYLQLAEQSTVTVLKYVTYEENTNLLSPRRIQEFNKIQILNNNNCDWYWTFLCALCRERYVLHVLGGNPSGLNI